MSERARIFQSMSAAELLLYQAEYGELPYRLTAAQVQALETQRHVEVIGTWAKQGSRKQAGRIAAAAGVAEARADDEGSGAGSGGGEEGGVMKWEYIVLDAITSKGDDEDLQEWLNRLGDDGWELAHVFGWSFVFKRAREAK